MACCYIAASMIAFIINSCDALDVNLGLQYNESVRHGDDPEDQILFEKQDTTERSGSTILSISGMTCAACTNTVEGALYDIEGVDKALVSLPLQEARIFHATDVNPKKFIEAVENVGYDASSGERSSQQKIATLRHTEELQLLRKSLRGLVISSTTIFSLGYGVNLTFGGFSSPVLVIAQSVLLFGLTAIGSWRYAGWIFHNAWSGACKGQLNMHSLISASTIIGLLMTASDVVRGLPVRYSDSIIGVLLIITVGRYMDLLSRRRAADTFTGLYSLMDETAFAKLSSLNKRVPTTAIRAGDEIIIDPFSVIPCDGYIIEGTSNVNESILTGESLPKPKTTGDVLLAGTRNGEGKLKVSIQQDNQRSFLSQLVNSIEGSLTSKASAQHRVDIVTQKFVSVIFAIAIIAASKDLFSYRDQGLYTALTIAGERMMAILAAACPCALGLATPCAVMAGIDVAWRKGVLMLEGGETMEIVQKISHVVLDKTGTLTRGTPQVTDMAISSSWKEKQSELAILICAAEEQSLSSHPLASAIFRKLLSLCADEWGRYQGYGELKDWEETGGRGVQCSVNSGQGVWRFVLIGNIEFMKESSIGGIKNTPDLDGQGSVVFVAVDGELAASLILQDTVRYDAKDTVDALKALSVQVSVLTGDNATEACRVSKELGIPVAGSCATPEMKLKHVQTLQEQGHKVMMVGDGMNDGPSLAAADVGAMMAHGRRCFTSGGDVLIFQSHLGALLTLLDISRATMSQVSMNIIWALVYNVVAVALAVGLGSPLGLNITPPIAAAMMSVSSIFITAQGLLLRARLSSKHGVSDE